MAGETRVQNSKKVGQSQFANLEPKDLATYTNALLAALLTTERVRSHKSAKDPTGSFVMSSAYSVANNIHAKNGSICFLIRYSRLKFF
jgi:hypothetical protein